MTQERDWHGRFQSKLERRLDWAIAIVFVALSLLAMAVLMALD